MTRDEARRRFVDLIMPQADHAFRLACWLTRSPHDAEDIVQEASLRAFRAIADYAGGSPRAWFLTIVRRTAFTWIAKNRPKDLVFSDDLDERDRNGFDANPAPTPEHHLLARQRSDRISAAVEALPLHFREALVLCDLEGLGYREIADILNVPIGTIMSRLARARASLSKALVEERS